MTAADGPAAPPTTGRRVRLRPLTPGDYQWLYDIGIGAEGGWRWRHRGSTPSPEAHIGSVWNDALVNQVAERRTDGRRVAFVSAMRADFRNGHCYFAALADPAFARSVYAAEAVGLFLVNLLVGFPFRKVYLETPEFNALQFGSALTRFFEEEGRLREYEFYDGRLWDYLICSVSRPVVEGPMARLVGVGPRISPTPADPRSTEGGR